MSPDLYNIAVEDRVRGIAAGIAADMPVAKNGVRTLDPLTILFILRLVVLAFECLVNRRRSLDDVVRACQNPGIMDRVRFRRIVRRAVKSQLAGYPMAHRNQTADELIHALFRYGGRITESEASAILHDTEASAGKMVDAKKLLNF